MRVRALACAAALLAVTALAIFSNGGGHASAQLQDDAATPTAATSEGASKIVTLVGWYTPDPSGDFLTVGPIRTNGNLVAGVAEVGDRDLTGKIDFDDADNDELPRITLGESVFDAYPIDSDDPDSTFRWLYIDDDPGVRPATLVIQINATAGPYDGFSGTATFVSRASDSGGVLVIVLNPPSE